MLSLKTVRLKEILVDYGLMLPEMIMDVAPNTPSNSFFYRMDEGRYFPEARGRREILIKRRVFLVNFGEWIRAVDAVKYAIDHEWRPVSLRTLLSLPYHASNEILDIFKTAYSEEDDEMGNIIFMSMLAMRVKEVCYNPFLVSYGGEPLELSRHRIKRDFEFGPNHWFIFENKD